MVRISMKELIKNKRVLFITTKNIDYIRNVQEISIISKFAKSHYVIGSGAKSYFKRMAYVIINILKASNKNYDIIFIGFAPQLIIPLFGWKFKGKLVIIDFFISLYDTFVFDRKIFSAKSLPGVALKWIDKKTLEAADHVIADTNEHGKYFSEEFGISKQRLETIYLEADNSIFNPKNVQPKKKNNGLFSVLYFGSILPLQGIDIILNAVNLLKDSKGICFTIIGPLGEKYDKVVSDKVTYYNWVSQEKLALLIAESDLCLAGHFNKDIPKANRTIPGKAYIYEMMEKPMILGDNAANRELFSEDEKHFFVNMGDAKALSNKILSIKNL